MRIYTKTAKKISTQSENYPINTNIDYYKKNVKILYRIILRKFCLLCRRGAGRKISDNAGIRYAPYIGEGRERKSPACSRSV